MFTFHELDILKDALEAGHQEDTEIYKKVSDLQNTMWFPGHVLPPMYNKFYIEKDGKQYFAKRVELAEAYAPKNISLLLEAGESWEEQTLNVGDFKWRYL